MTRSPASPTSSAPAIVRVPLSKLHPALWNPRTIKDARFQQLCRSLEADPDFLWQRPILATLNGTVFAGNMRVRAGQHLGWADMPAILCDIPEQLAQERGLRDNNQFGDWAEDDLAALLKQLEAQGSELGLLGFDDKELHQLLARLSGEPAADPGPQLDRAEELRAQWGTALGQLWEVPSLSVPGRAHRLLCGSSLLDADVQRVMNGERAALMATDSPYLVDYTGEDHPQGKANKQRGANPNKQGGWDEYKDPESSLEFFSSFIRVALATALTENPAIYTWHATRRQVLMEQAWIANGLLVHQTIIWIKPRAVLTHSYFMWGHEPCFFGWVEGHPPTLRPPANQTTVWAVGQDEGQGRIEHPTVKATELIRRPMLYHLDGGGLAYEPFSGSGTAFVAAEQTGRLCYGLELEPAFVAVALERLAGMGLAPRLAEPAP